MIYIRRREREYFRDDRADLREHAHELGILGGVFWGELSERFRGALGVVEERKRATVRRKRDEPWVGTKHLQPTQIQVADDVSPQRAFSVQQRRALESGVEFFRRRHAA